MCFKASLSGMTDCPQVMTGEWGESFSNEVETIKPQNNTRRWPAGCCGFLSGGFDKLAFTTVYVKVGWTVELYHAPFQFNSFFTFKDTYPLWVCSETTTCIVSIDPARSTERSRWWWVDRTVKSKSSLYVAFSQLNPFIVNGYCHYDYYYYKYYCYGRRSICRA